MGRGEREGERVGRKGIPCSQYQTFNQTPFTHEQGAIAQFDWLVARQSKSDIRNLTSMHNPTSVTQQDQNTLAESKEAFEFSVQEMLKKIFCKTANTSI